MSKQSQKLDLEKRLIEDFRQDFFSQLGYFPIVSTEIRQKNLELPLLNLNDLEAVFYICFPEILNKPNLLKKKDRRRELVDIRCLFSHFARVMTYKLSVIGKFLGDKHHTTILHYTVLFQNQMDTNPYFVESYNKVYSYLKKVKDESSVVE